MRPLILVLFIAVAGCRSTGAARGDLFGEPTTRGNTQIQIIVTNNNFNDATLHAITGEGGSQRKLLGTVTGKSRATYTLTWRSLAPLQIEIDVLAGGRCATDKVSMNPGDAVDLMLGLDDDSRDCELSD